MAYDLMSLLLQQGINGDYGAMYPAPPPQFRPSITQPNGREVQVPSGAVQEAQPTQTPMAAAMMPQRPAQAPQGAPQQAGWFDRLQHREDSSAINDGLINAGAAMLGGKDLQQGMAGALVGFNDAYDARKAQTKAESTPKVIPLADGAFSMLVFPDGTQKVVENGEVAQYITGQKDAQNAAMVGKMLLENKLQTQRDDAKENRAVVKDTQGKVNDLEATIQQFADSKGAIERHGVMSQVASYLPKGMVGIFSPETAVDNQRITQLTVQKVLEAGNALKGATSDRDMQFLRQSAPGPEASRAELLDWHTRAVQAMQNIQAKLVAQNNAAGGSATASAPSDYQGAASKGSAPAKSGAFKYLD